MDTADFLTLALLAAGGEIEGKTKLQKTVYFLGLLSGRHEDLGFRPHFYGPYSDDVADAILQLKTIGAVDQNVTDWGFDRSGFEVKRYEYRLNDAGRKFANAVAKRNSKLWENMQSAYAVYKRAGEKDYMSLSIAAKTYFLLGQKRARASEAELSTLASRFGWMVKPEQIRHAAEYLSKLGLVEPVPNQT